MSLADDLRAAKALIDTPEKWAGLRSSTGSGIAAACYGAVDLAPINEIEGRVDKMVAAIGGVWAPGDSSTHERAVAIFDRAIAAAESGAQP